MNYQGREQDKSHKDVGRFFMRPQNEDEIGFMEQFVDAHIVCRRDPDDEDRFVFERKPEPTETRPSQVKPSSGASQKAKPKQSDNSG